ncbi:CGNR zinc finger domain-containing protein [Amycolatopsis pithecellobii]|nr:CGNR zinc finger domain-containing protein [Amycolatopsis pithecellobii]
MPAETGLVRAFVNTLDLRVFTRHGEPHEQLDALDTPAALTRWLHGQDLIADADHADLADFRLAHTLRAALRAAVGEAGDVSPSSRPLQWPACVTIQPGGPPALMPTGFGVEAGLGRIAVAAAGAVADGTWLRLKMCDAPDCRWIFYDRSKPGRARWCEPALCGNRMKTRAYRERRREAGSNPR